MAEERSKHCWSDLSELHDAGDDDGGQRLDIRGGGNEHSRHGDERGGDADGEPGASSADDHDATGESDGDGGADGDVHGGGGRDRTAELPVAEERREHRRSDFSKLHHAGDDDGG